MRWDAAITDRPLTRITVTGGVVMAIGITLLTFGLSNPGGSNALWLIFGGVLATFVIGRRMHRVLVESWNVEKAVEEAHKKVVAIYARHQGG